MNYRLTGSLLPALLILAVSGISLAQQPPPAAPPAAPPPAPAPQPESQTTQPPPANYPPPAAYPPPATYPPPAGYPPAGQQPQPYGYPPPPAGGYPPPPGGYPPPPGAQWAGPEYLPYEDGQSIPQGYMLQSRPRRGLIIAGSLMVGIPYVLGVTFAGDMEDEDAWLLVPVIGPWATLAGKDFSCDQTSTSIDFECETDKSVRTLLILDGLTQGAGAFMLIYGIASHSQRLVRQDLYQGFVVTPHFSAGGAGLLATGQF